MSNTRRLNVATVEIQNAFLAPKFWNDAGDISKISLEMDIVQYAVAKAII